MPGPDDTQMFPLLCSAQAGTPLSPPCHLLLASAVSEEGPAAALEVTGCVTLLCSHQSSALSLTHGEPFTWSISFHEPPPSFPKNNPQSRKTPIPPSSSTKAQRSHLPRGRSCCTCTEQDVTLLLSKPAQRLLLAEPHREPAPGDSPDPLPGWSESAAETA